MKLTIQIVNFRSRHFLPECLFSILENLPKSIEAEILIINNDEDALEVIPFGRKGGTHFSILDLGKNIGFGKAHNAGFERSRGEFVLFLNPDTKILPESLHEMLAVLEMNEKIGVVGPLLVDLAEDIQPDCFGARRTPLSTIKKKIFRSGDRLTNFPSDIFETDWVSGGAMLVRRKAFERTGGFDENFFMYFEDVDFCLRAKRQGFKVAVNPKARIFHESGKSFASESEKKKYYYASQDHYFRKHFGKAAAALVKLLRIPYYVKNIYFNH